MSKKKTSIGIVLAAVLALALIGFFYYRHLRQPITLTGAVIVQDTDFRKELPIAGVEVRVANNQAKGPVQSDTSGFFSLRLFKRVLRGQLITIEFRHPNYQPLDLIEAAGDRLYIARMVPIARTVMATPAHPAVAIGNVRVRYSTKIQRSVNIGSAAKTFEVENIGNVPCPQHLTCSPDHRWKATVGSVNLDAGAGNEFKNARLSCIAGPCPFTRIDADEFTRGGQKISAAVRDWSDTTTFLLEAEVVHTMGSQIDYQSFPVIFGTALSFTLPAQAEGVSLEADVTGETIIFPLGPELLLDWANCSASTRHDQTKVYRCELKPGYKFQ